jgi:beta-lactamase class A
MSRRARIALLTVVEVCLVLAIMAAIAEAPLAAGGLRASIAGPANAVAGRAGGPVGVSAHAGLGSSVDRPTTNNPFASAALRSWIAQRHGRVTAAVYDIDTGQEYLYKPQYAEKTASTVKVDILATALHQAQVAHHPLPADEAAAAVPMITESDNDAAEDLYDDIGGWTAIGPFDKSIGMTRTTPNDEGYFGETYTTAADQITLLKQVMLPGGELSVSSRRYEYELMRHVIPSQRWGITGGVPATAHVAIKNGWLPETSGWHVNSIGRVQGDGRNYLIAVYTEWNSSWDYGIDTIQHVAAATWKAMGVQQGVPTQHYGPTPASHTALAPTPRQAEPPPRGRFVR